MFFPFCSFSVSLLLLSVLFSLFLSFPLCSSSFFLDSVSFAALLFFFLFSVSLFLLSVLFSLFLSFPLYSSPFFLFFVSFSVLPFPRFSAFLFLLSGLLFCPFPLSRFALSPLFPFLPFSFSLSLVFFTSCYLRIKSFFTIVRKTIRQLYE